MSHHLIARSFISEVSYLDGILQTTMMMYLNDKLSRKMYMCINIHASDTFIRDIMVLLYAEKSI